EFVDKTICNNDGHSLLNFAITKGSSNIAVLLSQDPELVNMIDRNGHPPSVCFRKNIDENVLKTLINNGMDINKRSVIMAGDKAGQECGTLLHRIALFGTKDDFEIAKKYGANSNVRNISQERPKDVLRRLDKATEFTL
ncbi:hypothetical protein LMH73_018830, partial [Vibrio splendidus]